MQEEVQLHMSTDISDGTAPMISANQVISVHDTPVKGFGERGTSVQQTIPQCARLKIKFETMRMTMQWHLPSRSLQHGGEKRYKPCG